MLATYVARRGTTPGTAPRTPRTRTLHIQTELHPANCTQSKPDWKDPLSRKADWRLPNPKPGSMLTQEEMQK
ncbi:hypothetical protein TIFTF001_049370 [Ficus carica]|uniref:Uncharacterized protein n=1 Tax=Ficus carica TaxID=3494 RepID=A0AA87Z0E1_FICCA|nr:hypothetical protein TIFTF001_049370 [Ficus carica]